MSIVWYKHILLLTVTDCCRVKQLMTFQKLSFKTVPS